MDARQIVPIVVDRRIDGVVETVVGGCVTAIVVPVGNCTLGNGHDFNDIAIANGIAFVDGIRPQIINSSRL